MRGQRRDKVLILREFGDRKIEFGVVTEVRKGSIRVPDPHGKMRRRTERILHSLTDLKEQLTDG